MNSKMTITILGTRGSTPVSGGDFALYGGATSCISISCENTLLFLDAGSGIMASTPPTGKKVSILLSHLHLDHLIGLPLYPALFQKGMSVDIYGKGRNGVTLEKALCTLFHPPYWPVGLGDIAADVSFNDVENHFSIGPLTIDSMEGSHPGGSTVYRVRHGDASFVYATDFEHNDVTSDKLAIFGKGADVLLYDAQYTDAEYPARRGFGHSTPSAGIKIAERAGVRRLLFSHHAPEHTDAQLAALEEEILASHPFASYARAGTRIEL